MDNIYKSLTLALKGQIRLVKILPSHSSGDIACEFEVVNLCDHPRYVALSYTWGNPRLRNYTEETNDTSSIPNRQIKCRVSSAIASQPNEHWYSILVTENLHSFLLRARDDIAHVTQSYWIDAICINQRDTDERERQVTMMSAIYQTAKTVYAWLGEEDKDTYMAFGLMRTLASRCRGTDRRTRIQDIQDITLKDLGTQGLISRIGRYADMTYWLSLARIFQRSYFTRVWIIQEITFANKMLAICGRNEIEWEDVVCVSQFLALTSWSGWISRVKGRTGIKSNHGAPNAIEVNKGSRNLLHILIRGRRFLSGDPRDKVYALLGVAGDSFREDTLLRPEYGDRTAAETYTLAAIHILENSDDLLLLCNVEGSDFQSIPNLPSWVPDWSCTKTIGLGITGYKRFAASAQVPRSLKIDRQSRRLVLKGVCLDKVILTGESKQEVMEGSQFPEWLKIINSAPLLYHTGQTRSEVLWRTLITDTGGYPPTHPAPDSYRNVYVSWVPTMLLAQTEPDISLSHKQLQTLYQHPTHKALFSTPLSTPLLINDLSSFFQGWREYDTTFRYNTHLRLFSTSKNYLGIGSTSLATGDSIWIIPGCRVPLILRDAGEDVFTVVGGAYVHGFMAGEGLQDAPAFKDIILA